MPESSIPLCDLCRQFSDDLVRFDFTSQETYPSDRWVKDKWGSTQYSQRWGDAFHHHDSLSKLAHSAVTCQLCHFFYDELLPNAPEDCIGSLLMHPFVAKRSTIIRFEGSKKMAVRPAPWAKQPHCYDFCLRRSHQPGLSFRDVEFYRAPGPFYHHAIPRDGTTKDVFDIPRQWLKECAESHTACSRGAGVLPKRVLDVGTEDTCRLYLPSSDDKSPYAALTHCRGGKIALTTTNATLSDRVAGIDLAHLPQNFHDAVKIVRELGLKHLWIDALCIIQDNVADWEDQAAKMAGIYSSAQITISALDSYCSDMGILKTDRGVREVVINDIYTLRRPLSSFEEVTSSCPLNTRGWCLQEKLLSPAILHFGSEQIFWECRERFASESDPDPQYPRRDFQQKFNPSQEHSPGDPKTWRIWYDAVERYSRRNLTVEADKFPAIAGIAQCFADLNHRAGGDYVAGLWVEHLHRGIMWSAAFEHLRGRGRKASGYNQCEVFVRPAEQRAPSWSWASVIGGVHFFWRNKEFAV